MIERLAASDAPSLNLNSMQFQTVCHERRPHWQTSEGTEKGRRISLHASYDRTRGLLNKEFKMRKKMLMGGATALLCVGAVCRNVICRGREARSAPARLPCKNLRKDRCADLLRACRRRPRPIWRRDLKLTAAQLPSWNKWRDAMLATAKTAEQACMERPARMTSKDSAPHHRRAPRIHAEDADIAARLDEKPRSPALEALYQSLDADQKEILNRHGEFEMRPPFGHGPRPERRGMLKG